jgi:phage anti-repressor protein
MSANQSKQILFKVLSIGSFFLFPFFIFANDSDHAALISEIEDCLKASKSCFESPKELCSECRINNTKTSIRDAYIKLTKITNLSWESRLSEPAFKKSAEAAMYLVLDCRDELIRVGDKKVSIHGKPNLKSFSTLQVQFMTQSTLTPKMDNLSKLVRYLSLLGSRILNTQWTIIEDEMNRYLKEEGNRDVNFQICKDVVLKKWELGAHIPHNGKYNTISNRADCKSANQKFVKRFGIEEGVFKAWFVPISCKSEDAHEEAEATMMATTWESTLESASKVGGVMNKCSYLNNPHSAPMSSEKKAIESLGLESSEFKNFTDIQKGVAEGKITEENIADAMLSIGRKPGDLDGLMNHLEKNLPESHGKVLDTLSGYRAASKIISGNDSMSLDLIKENLPRSSEALHRRLKLLIEVLGIDYRRAKIDNNEEEADNLRRVIIKIKREWDSWFSNKLIKNNKYELSGNEFWKRYQKFTELEKEADAASKKQLIAHNKKIDRLEAEVEVATFVKDGLVMTASVLAGAATPLCGGCGADFMSSGLGFIDKSYSQHALDGKVDWEKNTKESAIDLGTGLVGTKYLKHVMKEAKYLYNPAKRIAVTEGVGLAQSAATGCAYGFIDEQGNCQEGFQNAVVGHYTTPEGWLHRTGSHGVSKILYGTKKGREIIESHEERVLQRKDLKSKRSAHLKEARELKKQKEDKLHQAENSEGEVRERFVEEARKIAEKEFEHRQQAGYANRKLKELRNSEQFSVKKETDSLISESKKREKELIKLSKKREKEAAKFEGRLRKLESTRKKRTSKEVDLSKSKEPKEKIRLIKEIEKLKKKELKLKSDLSTIDPNARTSSQIILESRKIKKLASQEKLRREAIIQDRKILLGEVKRRAKSDRRKDSRSDFDFGESPRLPGDWEYSKLVSDYKKLNQSVGDKLLLPKERRKISGQKKDLEEKIIKEAKVLLDEKGILTKIVKVDGELALQIIPQSKKSYLTNIAKGLDNNLYGAKLYLRPSSLANGANASYSPRGHYITIPFSSVNSPNQLSPSIQHEIRHANRVRRLMRKEASPYDGSIQVLDGNKIYDTNTSYKKFLSIDEMNTWFHENLRASAKRASRFAEAGDFGGEFSKHMWRMEKSLAEMKDRGMIKAIEGATNDAISSIERNEASVKYRTYEIKIEGKVKKLTEAIVKYKREDGAEINLRIPLLKSSGAGRRKSNENRKLLLTSLEGTKKKATELGFKVQRYQDTLEKIKSTMDSSTQKKFLKEVVENNPPKRSDELSSTPIQENPSKLLKQNNNSENFNELSEIFIGYGFKINKNRKRQLKEIAEKGVDPSEVGKFLEEIKSHLGNNFNKYKVNLPNLIKSHGTIGMELARSLIKSYPGIKFNEIKVMLEKSNTIDMQPELHAVLDYYHNLPKDILNQPSFNQLQKFMNKAVTKGSGEKYELMEAARGIRDGKKIDMFSKEGDLVDHTEKKVFQIKKSTLKDSTLQFHLKKAYDQLAGEHGEVPSEGYTKSIKIFLKTEDGAHLNLTKEDLIKRTKKLLNPNNDPDNKGRTKENFDENSPWGELVIGELKALILIATKNYDQAKEYTELFLTFNDHSFERRSYFRLLDILIDIEIDETLDQENYKKSLEKMYGTEMYQLGIKTITGEIKFFGLTETNVSLSNLEKHQDLIKSYRKIQRMRKNFNYNSLT